MNEGSNYPLPQTPRKKLLSKRQTLLGLRRVETYLASYHTSMIRLFCEFFVHYFASYFVHYFSEKCHHWCLIGSKISLKDKLIKRRSNAFWAIFGHHVRNKKLKTIFCNIRKIWIFFRVLLKRSVQNHYDNKERHYFIEFLLKSHFGIGVLHKFAAYF